MKNKKQKILMVLMGLDIGGAETHVVGLSAQLVRMGREVVIASAGGVYESRLGELGIRHYTVPTDTRSPKDLVAAYRGLKRIILQEKPDLVHAHARIPAMLCGLLHRQLGFPFVTTAHWTFQVNPLLRLLTDWGQQTIAVSEDIRTYLMENYGVPAERIHLTVNGIDMEEFSPEASPAGVQREFDLLPGGQEPKPPVIACVTRFHESRILSVRLLAEAAPELARQLPGLRILLVGDGECMPELQAKAEEINRALGYRCLILTGARTDIPALINAADVFVGVSRAALEAMSCGKPTILCGNEGYGGPATKENADKNLATNYCCRDCAMATVEELTRDLLNLFALTTEQRAAMGEEGRDIVRRSFSLTAMAEACIRAYEPVLKKPRLVLSGYYGYRNQGDDAILAAFCARYQSRYEIMVLSRQPKETIATYGVRAVRRFSPVSVCKAIDGCTALISGGGSLLQDSTSTRSLLYYLWVIRRAVKRGRPVMVYANGVGPIRGSLNRRLTARVLADVQEITVRDEESARELKELGLTNEVTVTADPVFALELPETLPDRLPGLPADVPAGGHLLGISVRALREPAAAAMAEYLDRVCTDGGLTPVFLCMQLPQDGEAAARIAAKMKTKAVILSEPCSLQVLMGVLKQMELVITMRLHAMILAAAAGVPSVGMDYDPKLAAMARRLSLPLLHSGAGGPDPVSAAEETRKLIARREEVRAELLTAAECQRELAAGNDRRLTALLDGAEEKSG